MTIGAHDGEGRGPAVGTGTLLERLLGRWQVVVYLSAVGLGLGVGVTAPRTAAGLEPLVWPMLGALLLVTFLQVPLRGMRPASGDRRFVATALVGNFVLVPLLVLGLLHLLPEDPAVRLGVALVLLVPCTDWFITFAHLGGGDVRRAIVLTPLNLVVQLAALPLYLWLLLGAPFLELLQLDRVALVFLTVIALPLLVAGLLQRHRASVALLARHARALERLPVLLLAAVLLVVAASQVEVVEGVGGLLAPLLAVYGLYLIAALLVGASIGAAAGLSASATRTLTFSLGSRNSFVVLPFALALPEAWHLAVTVVVIQSLVELVGMLAYLRVVPRLVPLPDA